MPNPITDIVYIALTLGFLALLLGYAVGCERL